MNHWKMADIWQRLMTEVLGYEQYAAAGSDYGALITSQLGHKYAASLYGIHLGQDLLPAFFLNQERPWDLTEGHMVPKDAPEDQRKAIIHLQDTYASHVAVHTLDAQTITHGLNDSPVGLLAWILQRFGAGIVRRPSVVAGFVPHLASEEADFITGASLTIDGGNVAHNWKDRVQRPY